MLRLPPTLGSVSVLDADLLDVHLFGLVEPWHFDSINLLRGRERVLGTRQLILELFGSVDRLVLLLLSWGRLISQIQEVCVLLLILT